MNAEAEKDSVLFHRRILFHFLGNLAECARCAVHVEMKVLYTDWNWNNFRMLVDSILRIKAYDFFIDKICDFFIHIKIAVVGHQDVRVLDFRMYVLKIGKGEGVIYEHKVSRFDDLGFKSSCFIIYMVSEGAE